jgi:general secretion pathway protein F
VGIVLPKFAGILAELGQSLPLTTRVVLGAANGIRAMAIPVVLIGGGVILVGRAWINTPAGRRRWDAWIFAIPLIGTVRRAAATERFASTLSALLHSGVPLSAGLRASAEAVAIPLMTDRILSARTRVVAGDRLSVALSAESAVTPTALRLIRAGEASGRLSEMLHHAALLERERATQLVDRAVRLIEPALILVFGGMVALVAAALLQAVYSVRPAA